MSNLMYGLLSLLHHIPVLLLTSFWGLQLVFAFPALTESDGGVLLMLLPLLLSPAWCLWGIVRGIRRRRERYGAACAVASVIGLILFGVMFWAMQYIGSRY